MTKEEVDKLLEEFPWTFAKTYMQDPHHWTVLKDKNQPKDPDKWFAVVKFMHENSQREHWKYGKYFFYYRANGYKYWVMDKTIESTDLINRAKI